MRVSPRSCLRSSGVRGRWQRCARVGSLAALLFAWACAGRGPRAAPPPVAVRADAPAERMQVPESFWVPGERMRWVVSARGVVGAEVVLAVGQPGVFEGRHTVIVRSRVEAVGVVSAVVDVSAEIETWIDLQTALPVLRSSDARMGHKHRRSRSRFSAGKLTRSVNRGSGREYSYVKALPHGVALHDLHSMLGILRAWSPKEGSHAYLHSIEDGQVRRHLVRFTGREMVKTSLGSRLAMRLDLLATRGVHGTGRGKPYAIWISDDARRMPLLIAIPTRIGTIRLELVSYEPSRR